MKEPGSTEGDPFIFLNFHDQDLPDAHIVIMFRTTDYDEKFEFSEKLERALNRVDIR